MNRFKQVLCCLAAVMAVPMLFAAEPTISITATPRYPWNGKVDLAFMIEGDEGAKYDTSFSAQGVIGGTNLVMKTLYKSPGVKANVGLEKLLPGTYNWLWDAPADVGDDFVGESVVIDAKVGDAITYTVKFNANGGTGSMANETFESGVAKALTANAFTRTGYTFSGWATSASGSKVYSDKQSVTDLTTTAGGTVNLYAVWTSHLYMVIDLSNGANAKSYPVSYLDAVPSGGWSATYKKTKMVLRRCSAGSFTMNGYGASSTHKVTLSKNYYIGIFEVTQKQYALVMGSNPSSRVGDAYPVEQVRWVDIRGATKGVKYPSGIECDSTSFIGKLRTKCAISSVDLPTEAQWEYAGIGGGQLGKVAAGGSTATVGSVAANGWGLYDMQGNVEEWVADGYKQYGTTAVKDPVGDEKSVRVIKGGYYGQTSSDSCKLIYFRTNDSQSSKTQYRGFRVCVTL